MITGCDHVHVGKDNAHDIGTPDLPIMVHCCEVQHAPPASWISASSWLVASCKLHAPKALVPSLSSSSTYAPLLAPTA